MKNLSLAFVFASLVSCGTGDKRETPAVISETGDSIPAQFPALKTPAIPQTEVKANLQEEEFFRIKYFNTTLEAKIHFDSSDNFAPKTATVELLKLPGSINAGLVLVSATHSFSSIDSQEYGLKCPNKDLVHKNSPYTTHLLALGGYVRLSWIDEENYLRKLINKAAEETALAKKLGIKHFNVVVIPQYKLEMPHYQLTYSAKLGVDEKVFNERLERLSLEPVYLTNAEICDLADNAIYLTSMDGKKVLSVMSLQFEKK